MELWFLEACEIDPPAGVEPAHWLLLTTHAAPDLAAARRITGYYRQRWIIEQLFRILKTQGFDIERSQVEDGGPFENLVAAALIAAVQVLQMVRERDGAAQRPLTDAFDEADAPAMASISAALEGATARQRNPHPQGSLAWGAWTARGSAVGQATMANPVPSSSTAAGSASCTCCKATPSPHLCESRR